MNTNSETDRAGVSVANTRAGVEDITTVRVICRSLAPGSRAVLNRRQSRHQRYEQKQAPAV
jgi:hypothetical protein